MMVGDVTNVTLFSLTVACHCATIVRGIVQPSRRHLDHEEEDEEEKHRQPSFLAMPGLDYPLCGSTRRLCKAWLVFSSPFLPSCNVKVSSFMEGFASS